MSAPATSPAKPAAAPVPPGKDRPRRVSAYGWYCIILLILYGGVEGLGWGFQPGGREKIPMSVRQSPGGYRSYHFWHSGLHGGK